MMLRGVVVAVCGCAVLGCGTTTVTTSHKPSATAAAVNAAVRDYHACGLDVLTPSAEGDCLRLLLQRLQTYAYTGDAAATYVRTRSVGVDYRQCLDEVVTSETNACDGAPFYRLLTQLIRRLPSGQ
jgi:hypothetical protein